MAVSDPFDGDHDGPYRTAGSSAFESRPLRNVPAFEIPSGGCPSPTAGPEGPRSTKCCPSLLRCGPGLCGCCLRPKLALACMSTKRGWVGNKGGVALEHLGVVGVGVPPGCAFRGSVYVRGGVFGGWGGGMSHCCHNCSLLPSQCALLEGRFAVCLAPPPSPAPLPCWQDQPGGREGGAGGRSMGKGRPPPPCNMPSGCCFVAGPWTVTCSSLCMLHWVAALCWPAVAACVPPNSTVEPTRAPPWADNQCCNTATSAPPYPSLSVLFRRDHLFRGTTGTEPVAQGLSPFGDTPITPLVALPALRNMVFSKTTACSSYVQPWLVAIGGWRLVEIAGWQLAVGGWRRLAAVGSW